MDKEELNNLIVDIQKIITDNTKKTINEISNLDKDERNKIINKYGGEKLSDCMAVLRSYVLQQMASILFKWEDREDACNEFMADRFYKALLTFEIDKGASFLTYITASTKRNGRTIPGPIKQTAIDYYRRNIERTEDNLKPRGKNEEGEESDEEYYHGKEDPCLKVIDALMTMKPGFDSLHSTNCKEFNYVLAFHMQLICKVEKLDFKSELRERVNKSLNSEIIEWIGDTYLNMSSTHINIADAIFTTIEKHPDYNDEKDNCFFGGTDFDNTANERIRNHCEKIKMFLVNDIQS